jgi:MoxR-like ATPase
VRRVPIAPSVLAYAVRLARATRPEDENSPDFVEEWVRWGAGPRASQCLVLGGKVRALMRGRYAVSRDDIRAIALSALRHRIILSFSAEADGVTQPDIVTRLLDVVPRD